MLGNCILVCFGIGDEVIVQVGEEGICFLLIFGVLIQEFVVWYGFIVMNMQEEL